MWLFPAVPYHHHHHHHHHNVVSVHRPVLTGTPLELTAIPTARDSSFKTALPFVLCATFQVNIRMFSWYGFQTFLKPFVTIAVAHNIAGINTHIMFHVRIIGMSNIWPICHNSSICVTLDSKTLLHLHIRIGLAV
jgi:hypothetical protein